MRPVTLELHGFTAFREPVVVDFDGADLFALAGPTGAGKSSLIDAMCFALYGSVPRLDRRTVAPVVSIGKVEARIRFDFTVGSRAYTAVRVVRRTATGATTKEARLESEGQTLAGDADGMTAAVEEVLGLGFEQFTKCVVLPQGDFARFLHDKPAARQELLVKLLELGIYERMRAEAGTRRVAAESAAELLERQLAGLADATPQALAAAKQRVARLQQLRDEVDAAQPQLDALIRRREEALREVATISDHAAALQGMKIPEGTADLSEAMAQARSRMAAAAQELTTAEAAVTAAEKSRAALPDPTELTRIADDHDQLVALRERIAKGETIVVSRREEAVAAAAGLQEAEAAVAAAQTAVDAAKREHAAHALAATLHAGEPCPVCLQQVEVVPQRPAPPALRRAEEELAAATSRQKAAALALEPVVQARTKAEQHLDVLREQAAGLAARLADAAPAAQVAASLQAVRAADAALAEAREQERARRAAVRQAQEAAEQLDQRVARGWASFDAARDAVAVLSPPPIPREDLAAAWAQLLQWATTTAQKLQATLEQATTAATAVRAELEAINTAIAASCRNCDVPVTANARPRDAVADALASAEATQRAIGEAVERAAQLRKEREGHVERAAVAKALSQHLSARGFEQWLLDEALDRLAEGASSVLRELSGQQYSLALDAQRNFSVIDHRNADERRPARTLSGGETFLASLSLALTLADHLASLSVGSEPRLESIFLDEGFGTLDPETLDVVATAIEELGASGRTVGIVTHVRDLAERMPVRFEVSKAPAGSTVERVER